MFQKADSFHAACALINSRGSPDQMMAGFAMVVCSAFSCEAYLKVAANLEKGLLPLKTHDLSLLFEDLLETTKSQIQLEWESEVLPGIAKAYGSPHAPDILKRNIPTTFNEALRQSSFAFVEWRYGNGDDFMAFHMMALPMMLRSKIVALRPKLGLRPVVTQFPTP